MAARIVNWLHEDREPADLYELLGRPRFDPHRRELLAAVRAMYGELLPYQNHENPQVARRAVQLQRLLGRAEATLSDSGKLRAHHQAILERLREASVRAAAAGGLSGEQLLRWLQSQSVHPSRLEMVAGLLTAQPAKPSTLARQETLEYQPGAAALEGFLELEEQPVTPELIEDPPDGQQRRAILPERVDQAPDREGRPPDEPLLELISGPGPGRPGTTVPARVTWSQQIGWFVAFGLGVALLLVLLWLAR